MTKKKNNHELEIEKEQAAADTEQQSPEQMSEQANTDKLAETEERYLRLAAEYDNFKRRTQREKEAIFSEAVAYTVRELLPILDSMDRAVDAAKDTKDAASLAEGISMIAKMTQMALEKIGVDPIETVGKPFDTNLCEAVMHVDDDSYGENEVVEEFSKGYKYQDKVIRHSMVKVAN